MKFTLITPHKKKSEIIVWIEADTITGNYVIQPGHIAATLIILKNRPLTYCLKSGKQEIITPTENSILHIMTEEAILLLSE